MKKSQLTKIILESIKELISEQKRGGSGTCFATTTVDISEIPIKELGPQVPNDYHTWEVCSMSTSGTTVTAPWTGAFSFAALGITFGSALFGPTGTLNAFYGWAEAQVGPISIGDSITFDMAGTSGLGGGMCNWLGHSNIDTVCFKYLGLSPLSAGTCWNGTTATAVNNACCSTPVVNPVDKPIPQKCCDWCNTQTGGSPPPGCFDWMCDGCVDQNPTRPIIPENIVIERLKKLAKIK